MKISTTLPLILSLIGTSTALAEEAVPLPAAPAPAPPAPAVPPVMVQDTGPLAGYTNGSFFLRDPHDWFVLYPKGRMQIDSYNFLNPPDLPAGVVPNSDQDPRRSMKNTVFVRRIRAEMQGTFAGHFDFNIAGEFGTTPATGQYGTLTDAFVIMNYTPYAQLQFGQYDAPFTIENRTSDKYIDFMERSLAVRAFGVPSNKETGAMVFGNFPMHLGYYSLGIFNGAGMNFKSQDNNPAIIGRAFISPVGWMNKGNQRWLEDIWVGGSIWWKHNTNLGGLGAAAAPVLNGAAQNDIPTMTTQGGFGFFSANYGNGMDSAGNSIRSHLAPSGDNLRWALELNVPWKWIGLRAELVHQSIDLARYDDTNPGNALLARSTNFGGNLSGYGYYIELYGWILGDVNFLETPGLEPMPHFKKFTAAKEPRWGLMLLAKYEHVGFDVTGLPIKTDAATGAMTNDPAQGHYSIDAFELGVNAWLTKHVRLTANYVMNYIGAGEDATAAANEKKNAFYQRAEHELLFRVGVNL